MTTWLWRRRFVWAALAIGALLFAPFVVSHPVYLFPLACLAAAAIWVGTDGWRHRRGQGGT